MKVAGVCVRVKTPLSRPEKIAGSIRNKQNV